MATIRPYINGVSPSTDGSNPYQVSVSAESESDPVEICVAVDTPGFQRRITTDITLATSRAKLSIDGVTYGDFGATATIPGVIRDDTSGQTNLWAIFRSLAGDVSPVTLNGLMSVPQDSIVAAPDMAVSMTFAAVSGLSCSVNAKHGISMTFAATSGYSCSTNTHQQHAVSMTFAATSSTSCTVGSTRLIYATEPPSTTNVAIESRGTVSWAATRTGATLTVQNSAATDLFMRSRTGPTTYIVLRSVMFYDLSALSGKTVVAAVQRIKSSAKTAIGNEYVTVAGATTISQLPLASTDYTLLVGPAYSASFEWPAAGSDMLATLNETGIAYLNTLMGSSTKAAVALRHTDDANNTPNGTTDSYMSGYMPFSGNGTNRPYIKLYLA